MVGEIETKYMGTSLKVTPDSVTFTSMGKVMGRIERHSLVLVTCKRIGAASQFAFEGADGTKFRATVGKREAAEQLQQEFAAFLNPGAVPAVSVAAPAVGAAVVAAGPQQITREYTCAKEMMAGIAQMERVGWRVQSQSSYQPSAGVGRVVALGFIGAAVIKPKAKFVVTFTR